MLLALVASFVSGPLLDDFRYREFGFGGQVVGEMVTRSFQGMDGKSIGDIGYA